MVVPEWVLVTGKVIDVLEALSIRYVIGGSIASIIHGTLRSTLDADIVAEMEPQHVAPFVEALQSDFYAEPEMILNAIRHRTSFNLLHQETMFKVDIFIPKMRAFDAAQLDHRVKKLLSSEVEREAWVLSPEDIILAKLDWYNIGHRNSERQWRDVLGVIKSQSTYLDKSYLAKMASLMGISDLIENAMTEASMS